MDPGDDGTVPTAELPIDLRSVGAARALLAEVLDGFADGTGARPEVADAALLMVSELVTNAVLHSRGLLRLEITAQDGVLHVGVVDDAPGPPTPRDPAPDAVGGRGLRIVDALAQEWGFTRGAGSKTVWFRVALP